MNRISNERSKFRPAAGVLAASLIVAPVTLLPVAQAAQTQSVSDETAAENVVRTDVQAGMNILNDQSLSAADRRAQIRELFTSLTDIRGIALFTLGSMRQYAKPAQIEQFVDAFRNYAVAAYEAQLTDYSGQYLRVTGSIQTAPGNYIIKTVVVNPNGGSSRQAEPIEVDIRLTNDSGHYVVTDLSVAGIWLALEERDQFTTYLEDHNGDFGALIVYLKVLTERLHHDAPSARIATATQAQ
jgi:phospholipid transport system substrate-binding protein